MFEGSRLLTRAAIALFLMQFLGLCAYSWVVYQRFNLGIDFAFFNQAASQIGHGNLDPYSTVLVQRLPFIDDHFSLIMWPIAALMVVIRTPFFLLVWQNFFLAATGFLTFLWASKMVARRRIHKGFGFGILGLAGILLLVNPLVYYTAALDVHFESTATFFAIFAAFDLWQGRSRRAWIWVAICLLCGDLGGLYVAGVGVSALLAGKTTRRMGLFFVLAGLAWVAFIGAIHANQGSLLDQYAYLANRTTIPSGIGGAFLVLAGVIGHPNRVFHQLHIQFRLIWRYLPPGGVIGLITPWGIGVPALVLLSSALQNNTLFIGEPFQQFSVMPFLLIGTVSLLTALVANDVHLWFLSGRAWARKWTRSRSVRWAMAGFLMFAVALEGARYAHEYLSNSFTSNAAARILPSSTGSALATVLGKTPSDAEVISSIDVVGRFSARQHAYIYFTPTYSIPIRAHTVELVMDTTYDPYITPQQGQAAASLLIRKFHARTLIHTPDVWALRWTAPSTKASITLP